MEMTKTQAEILIERLNLKPLAQEGGYFRETYRAERKVDVVSEKSISTCIYFLIADGTFSAFHKLPSDEIWHFYAGDPVELSIIDKDGELHVRRLDASLLEGTAPQVVVPAGCWQGARLAGAGKFALLGCTVAPAFDFSDYVHGHRQNLLDEFPEHRQTILNLTRE